MNALERIILANFLKYFEKWEAGVGCVSDSVTHHFNVPISLRLRLCVARNFHHAPPRNVPNVQSQRG